MKNLLFIALFFLVPLTYAFGQDSDGDGLTDAIEDAMGTDRLDADTDNDGLSDGIEDADHDGIRDGNETSPLDSDTDDDGVRDGEEVFWSLDPLDNDTDNDALNDGQEIGRDTRLPGGTSDGLGIPYSGTSPGWMIDVNTATRTDPLDFDTDNDGIPDGSEDADRDGTRDGNETSPFDADSDDDGIADGEEDLDQDRSLDMNETDPLVYDTDGDGLNDGLEKGYTSPVPAGTSNGSYIGTRVEYLGTAGVWMPDANAATRTDARDPDSDDDGRLDGLEDENGDGAMNAAETDPMDADTDDDGINDGNEAVFNLDPLDADTDNDGLNDGLELGIDTPVMSGTSDSEGRAYLGTAASWTADSDNTTTTNPESEDTDGDGLSDGIEDANRNGAVDIGETDPVLNDTDADGLPDGVEDADLDGIVDIGETDPLDPDTDADGATDGVDCAPLNPSVYPGAPEIPGNDLDEDCNGYVSCYTDADDDAYGAGTYDDAYVAENGMAIVPGACWSSVVDGWSENQLDCDDSESSINPSAAEVVGDGVDQDCDGAEICFLDADDDGYRPDAISTTMSADLDCIDFGEALEIDPTGDCNDTESSVNPGAVEIPGDGIDQDCDGTELCFLDADDDGYRPDATSTTVSTDLDCLDFGEAIGTDPTNDCDDTNNAVYPGAEETCDNVDNNCDGVIPDDTESSITVASCDTYTAPDDMVYTSSGIVTAVIPNVSGCDSTITIDLTINASTAGTDTRVACGTFTWIDGNTYTESNNTATFILTNAAECDSLVTLDLTIDKVILTTSTENTTITADETGAEYQWIDCADNSIIEGETGRSFTATENGNYAVIISKNSCLDTTACVSIIGIGIPGATKEDGISVFPNPTSGRIYIEFGEKEKNIRIRVLDILGRSQAIFEHENAPRILLDIEGKKGVYFVEITTETQTSVIRVVKE
jgi:hypothetical protein